MVQPLISIIIPTLNRAHLIGETLDSVLAQTYTNWECIVVDDGSSDNTDAVLKTYCDKDVRFKYVHRPDSHKPGGNGARNYGFELSKGEYVNWFDSDDLMHPEKLEKQIWPLHNLDYNFSVCQTLVFEGSKDNILGLRHEKIISEKVLEDFIKNNIVFLTPAPLLRKSFLNENHIYYDEELIAAQDWEYFVKILYYTREYLTDETPLVYIRKHNKSISHNNRSEEREWHYYLAREKVFSFFKKNDFVRIELACYFKSYFSDFFLNYTKKKNLKKSCRVLFKSLCFFYSDLKTLRILLMLCFYMASNKGYLILKKNLLY